MWFLTLALFSLYSLRDGFVSAACDVYLPQLQYTSKKTCPGCHLSGFGVNVWHGNNAMNMGDGNSYQEFLVIHPVDDASGIGYVEYALNGQYDTFSGIIGQANPSNGCEDSTSFGFKFKIYVDGNQKFESITITKKEQFENTGDINVKNAMVLRIETVNMGLNTCDHATIAVPKLVSTTNCCCTSNVDKARYFAKCQRFKNQENKCLRADDPDSGEKQCSFMFCGFVDGLCRVDKNYQGSLKGIKQKKNCRAVTNLNDCEAIPYCNFRIGVPPFQLEEAEELEIKVAEGKLDMEMFNNIVKGNQSSLYQSNYNNILYIAIITIAILIISGLYKYCKQMKQYKHIKNPTSENNPLLINMQ